MSNSPTTIEVIEEQGVEIIQVNTPGAQGIQGPPGLDYEYTGGEVGQAWAVLPSGEYGWDDVRRPDREIVPFVNEHLVESQYTEKFSCRVYILGSAEISGHFISVTINEQLFQYENVGMFKIDSDNLWSQSSKRMCFKAVQNNSYIVFDDTVNSWVHGGMGDHSTNHRSNNNKTILSSIGTLPESFGNISIDVNYALIESKHFSLCDPKVEHFTSQNVIQVSFSGLPQVGFIIL